MCGALSACYSLNRIMPEASRYPTYSRRERSVRGGIDVENSARRFWKVDTRREAMQGAAEPNSEGCNYPATVMGANVKQARCRARNACVACSMRWHLAMRE
jgi:hypothetical protein